MNVATAKLPVNSIYDQWLLVNKQLDISEDGGQGL